MAFFLFCLFLLFLVGLGILFFASMSDISPLGVIPIGMAIIFAVVVPLDIKYVKAAFESVSLNHKTFVSVKGFDEKAFEKLSEIEHLKTHDFVYIKEQYNIFGGKIRSSIVLENPNEIP